MNQILTDEEIFKLQYELQYREGGFHPIPFARAIEQAILNKLREQKPVAYMLRNDVDGVDLSDEAFSWDKDVTAGHTVAVFTHPAPSVPTQVTCQLYGHVVGACDECNTHTEKDVNETNKILADNYLKLTCGSAPSVPEGYVMVPVEPSVDQIVEGQDAGSIENSKRIVRIYKAMLSAARSE